MEEWINKMWGVPTVEYYPALKGNTILAPSTTWMNLEDTTLNEMSQTQVPCDSTYMRHLEI